jgi:hypothetical protein
MKPVKHIPSNDVFPYPASSNPEVEGPNPVIDTATRRGKNGNKHFCKNFQGCKFTIWQSKLECLTLAIEAILGMQ